jgi:hypothetical protein
MATTDTSADALFEHRLSMIIEQGFNMEDALTLVRSTKLVSNAEGDRTYFYELPVSWHDVAKLKEAGATNDQILRILG